MTCASIDRRSGSRLSACGLLGMFVLAACDSVGQPLVDVQPGGETPAQKRCPASASCEPPEPEVEFRPIALVASAVSGCSSLPHCREPFGQGPLEPDRGLSDPSAGLQLAAPDCGTALAADRLEESDVAELSCERVLLTGDLGSPSGIDLDEPRWRETELVVQALSPYAINVEAGSVTRASVRLRGPITLRFTHATSLLDVSVSGERTEAGSPTLELDYANAVRLTVGTTEEPFEGHARMLRAELAQTQLVADTVELESTVLGDGFVQADAFNAADVQLSGVGLALEHGVIAAGQLAESEIVSCGALALLEARVNTTRFAPCDRGLRVYATAMSSVSASGPIESDESTWQYATLGFDGVTDMVLWSSRIYGGAFCNGAESLKLYDSDIGCSQCEDGVLTGENAVCLMALTDEQLPPTNRCASLLETVPQCGPPLPERVRATAVTD